MIVSISIIPSTCIVFYPYMVSDADVQYICIKEYFIGTYQKEFMLFNKILSIGKPEGLNTTRYISISSFKQLDSELGTFGFLISALSNQDMLVFSSMWRWCD